MTNAFVFKKAERKRVKLKIGISAASGGGKTYSALRLARGLASSWDKVALIDTENGSGELYDHLGDYVVANFVPPFSPDRYISAIETAEKAGFEVCIIDSLSHEWEGQGGCLDIVSRMGGKYQDWSKVTPLHRKLIDKILQTPMHVIATTRKKTDWAVDTNEKGKLTPRKLGTKDVQRDGIEYEWSLSFSLSQNHMATVDKDRTGIFSDRPEFMITEDTGQELLAWANSGKEFDQKAVAAQAENPLSRSQAIAVDPEVRTLFEKLGQVRGMQFSDKDILMKVRSKEQESNQRQAVIEALNAALGTTVPAHAGAPVN